MQLSEKRLWLSPSDLTVFLACAHAGRLSVDVQYGRVSASNLGSPEGEMLARKGAEHEAALLADLRALGKAVVEIDLVREESFETAGTATLLAMQEGADVIYQGAFVDERWRGLADFLLRVDTPSDLGGWSYEVLDTKLARTAKPSHILQLCFYSDAVARLQGVPPRAMHVMLGSREQASFRPDEFSAYYRRIRDRFERFVDTLPPTEPYPCAHCALCDFSTLCEGWWDETDHLSRVASIQRRQVDKLRAGGIPTLTDLADASRAVAGMSQQTFAKLQAQAALQALGATSGPQYELLAPIADSGFALLPASSPGDLFFDIEGHPFWEVDGGLEYLWGMTDVADRFDPLWAEDRNGERHAFETFVDRVHARLLAHPDMHVYHYAPYELTALCRLMGRYGTREAELDDLLRRQVFVDLYAVVRNGVRVSERSYSLKALEVFLPTFRRQAGIKDGATSIVEFEHWLQTGDSGILAAIAAYNEEDCVATRQLRDWLLRRKAEAIDAYGPVPAPDVIASKPIPPLKADRAALRAQLLATGDTTLELAAQLLDYHDRERKPVWWAMFDRFEQTPEELVEDADSIGALTPTGPSVSEKLSRVWTLEYPAQEHKLRVSHRPLDPATRSSAGEILEIDADKRQLQLKRGPSLATVPLPGALIPDGPLRTREQEAALVRFCESLLTQSHAYPALESVLRREPFDRSIQTTDLEALKLLVRSLDGQYLVIQGPPGSGKTWTAGRLVADLLATGSTVGVASTSHKAIQNMLDEVEVAATELGASFDGRKKASAGNPESYYASRNIDSVERPGDVSGAALAAGTAWLFAHSSQDAALDYLFIDEAGQVSLADVIAMGTSARNLVMIGDPVQLSQVLQGTHPDGADASVLSHLLGEHATVPEDRGIFLEQTYRLHPDVCGYISEVFYEGRLRPVACTSLRTTPLGTGLRYLAVDHEGNRQSSEEESEAVAGEIARLRHAGVPLDHVMVVAPFNAQVVLLRERLPTGVRVGTVDKFQGQEAPVVLYSMASSSGADVPRGLDFLLSGNRLNVAVSRAQCLAYLVCSPRLLEVDCNTIDHMRLANALCRFVEIAE